MKAFVVLDSDGERVLAKYYDGTLAQLAAQRQVEKQLHEKTKGQNSDVLMLESSIVLYRVNLDVTFFVLCVPGENELILANALDTFFEALSELVKVQIDRSGLLEHYDVLSLLLDEFVDGGIILESDPRELAARVTRRGMDGFDLGQFSEHGVAGVLRSAQSQLSRTLLK